MPEQASGQARAARHTGGCQCGRVRYALYADPAEASICHCRMCQKATGGPFAIYAPVAAEDFAWTRGKPATFASSSVAARDFCADCGTPLTFRYLSRPRISVSIGSLDRPERVRPRRHYGIESRIPWMQGSVLDMLPVFCTGQDEPPGFLEGMVSHQHPDRDDPG
jgi:hypothetical protein